MNGFGQPSTMAPWGQLPAAQAPWSGSETWQAAQQSPWRLSPWQTQGMPQQQTAPQQQQQPASSGGYFPQGMSTGLDGFNPSMPGGGFYPGILGPQQMAQQSPPGMQQDLWTTRGQGGGQVYDSQQAATQAATTHNNLNVADGGFGSGAGLAPARMGGGLLGIVGSQTPNYGRPSGAEMFQQLYGRR